MIYECIYRHKSYSTICITHRESTSGLNELGIEADPPHETAFSEGCLRPQVHTQAEENLTLKVGSKVIEGITLRQALYILHHSPPLRCGYWGGHV